VEQVFRAADEVLYCFDGDRAGRQAAWRALESTLPRLREGRQARFLFLPEGEDPDTMVRAQGTEAFARLLESAQPLSEFFFSHFSAQVDLDSIDGRARLVELARPELMKLPEGVYRDMMMERLEKLAQHRFAQTPGRALPECDLPGLEIFREVVDFCDKHPNMSTAQLLELWRDHPAQPHLRTLATWPLEGEAGQQAQEFGDALTSLELQWTEARIENMPGRVLELGAEEQKRLLELQQKRQALRRALSGDTD
jgi:DNA primase